MRQMASDRQVEQTQPKHDTRPGRDDSDNPTMVVMAACVPGVNAGSNILQEARRQIGDIENANQLQNIGKFLTETKMRDHEDARAYRCRLLKSASATSSLMPGVVPPLVFGLELSGDGDELKLLQKDNVAKVCLTGLIYGRARHPDCRNMLDDVSAKDLPELLPTWTDADLEALIRKWEDDNTRTVPLEKPKPRPQDSRARATIPPTGANQAVVGAAISAQTRARSSSRSRNKRKKAEGIAVASGYKSIAEKVMDGTIQDGTKPGPGVIKAVTEAVNANPKVFSQVSPLKLRDGYSWANIPRLDGENYGRFLALRDMFNIGLNKSRLHPKFEGWAEACEQVQATKYGKDVLNTFLAWKAANPKPEMKSKAKSGTAGSDGFTSP